MQPALGDEVALRRRREHHACHRRGDDRQDQLEGVVDADQQQLGVEDEHERQDRRPRAVAEGGEAGQHRFALGDAGGRVRGQTHRWRHVGHQAEIEHEHVHRDQRHQQSGLRAQLDDHRRHQRRHHDVVRRGRQAHAQHQADDRHQDQHDHQVAARQHLNELGHRQADAGERDRADDDAGGRGGDRDADHVARTGHQAREQIREALLRRRADVARATEEREQRTLGDEDEHQEQRRPECRQRRRELLDHQVPDQRRHRQQEVQAGLQRRADLGQELHLLVGLFHVQLGEVRRIAHQPDVGPEHQQPDDDEGAFAEHGLQPAETPVDDRRQDDEAGDGQRGRDHRPLPRQWLAPRQALQVHLQGFEVHDVVQRDVRDQCRQDRVLHHLHVGDADVLDHQEGRRAHHRRHDLAVDRR